MIGEEINCKISKESFVKLINICKKYNSIIDDIIATNIFNINNNPLLQLYDEIVKFLVGEVELNSEDKNYYPIIYQYVYDCNYGREDFYIKIDDKEYNIKTPEQLYDIIIKIYYTKD